MSAALHCIWNAAHTLLKLYSETRKPDFQHMLIHLPPPGFSKTGQAYFKNKPSLWLPLHGALLSNHDQRASSVQSVCWWLLFLSVLTNVSTVFPNKALLQSPRLYCCTNVLKDSKIDYALVTQRKVPAVPCIMPGPAEREPTFHPSPDLSVWCNCCRS